MSAQPEITLYTVPASHPCACVERALELKQLPYRRIDLLPVVAWAHQRVAFGKRTVPGIKVGGDRAVGSRLILRVLEAMRPEPALLPADGDARAAVEEAEEWGDEVLQPLGRRLVWAALRRDPQAMRSFSEGASLPVPLDLAMASAAPVARLEALVNRAADDAAAADLRSLPGHLDRIEGWIDSAVIGAEQPNAADLQIGSTLRLLMTLGDVRPLLAGRPAGELATRTFPDFPGNVPAGTLPAAWLPAAAQQTG